MKNFNNSNIDGSFTVADLNSFFYFITNSSASLRQQFFRDILDTLWKVFLFQHENLCCVCTFELPHGGDSNEHTIIVLTMEKDITKSSPFAS